jgi:hypothetical protein
MITNTQLTAASDKVYQLLAHGLWFSPGTPVSSTTKTGRHDITESGVKHYKSIKTINQQTLMITNTHSLHSGSGGVISLVIMDRTVIIV